MLVVVTFFGGMFIGGVLAGLWAAFGAFGLPPITAEQGFAVAYLGGVLCTVLTVALLWWGEAQSHRQAMRREENRPK